MNRKNIPQVCSSSSTSFSTSSTSFSLHTNWIPGMKENGSFGPPVLLPENPIYQESLSIVQKSTKNDKKNFKLNNNNNENNNNKNNNIDKNKIENRNKLIISETINENLAENGIDTINPNPFFYQNPCHIFTVFEPQTELIFSLFQPDKRWNILRFPEYVFFRIYFRFSCVFHFILWLFFRLSSYLYIYLFLIYLLIYSIIFLLFYHSYLIFLFSYLLIVFFIHPLYPISFITPLLLFFYFLFFISFFPPVILKEFFRKIL